MARPLRMGLDYFNIDITQEDNLNLIEAKHGIIGYGVVIKIWRKIYAINGYYCEWQEKHIYLFAKEVGVPVDILIEIVNTCFQEEIFNQKMYNDFNILTSSGTQKRWKRIVTDSKRKMCEIDKKHLLIKLTPENTELTPEETHKIQEETPQSKVKKSKVKESKVKEITKAPAVPKNEVVNSRRNFKAPDLEELTNYVIQKMGDPKKHRPWPEDKCKNFSAQIFDHYTANGWVQGKSRKPIVDWQAAVRTCIRNEMEKTNSNQIPARQEPTQTAPAIHQPQIEKKKLEKPAIELNYLFERFLEDQTKITIISIETLHYDFLKRSGLINFNKDEIEFIRRRALTHSPSVINDETKLLQLMKKFGVLSFFEKQILEGKQIIFNVDGKETAAA